MSDSLKQKTFKGVLWTSFERFSSMGISFAFSVLIARLLAPSDYGILAMLGIFLSISGCFVSCGFATALVRMPDRTEEDFSTAFYFNVVVAIIAYSILFLSAPLIADFYDTPLLTPVARVSGLNLILGALSNVQSTFFAIRLDFKTPTWMSLAGILLSSPLALYLAYTGWGVWALVFSSVFSSAFRTILLWIIVGWKPRTGFSVKSFRTLFGFGSKLLASAILDITYNNIYPIVIGKKFCATELGYYARADHWGSLPATSLTGVLQQVTFPVLCGIQNEDERLQNAYRKFLRISAFIIFPLMVGLAATADPLVRFLLTDKWAPCVPLLQVLCFALMWYPIHAINLNLLQVKGRSDLFLRLEIIKKILGVATLCVTIPLGLFAMCAGRVFTSLICLSINTHYTGKLVGLGYWRQMADLCPTLCHSLICGAIAYAVQLCLPEDGLLLRVLVATAAGGLYYILANALLKTLEWQEMLSLIRRKNA